MKSHLQFLLLLLLAIGHSAHAQRGKNGAGTITAASTVVNTYTTLTANAGTGATSLSVANSALTGGAFGTTALATGDLVMIIQMQGAGIATTNTAGYGAVSAYNNAGNYELSEVRSVPNATTIVVACGLQKAYTAAGRVQIVRIPRYTTLTLNTNTSIVPTAWNGSTGGIVSIETQGDVIMNTGSSINATGLGFRGGVVVRSATAVNGALGYLYNTNANGAEKGESIAGYQTDYDNLGGRYGRGAPANGGGGGNNHNASGGGGANVSATAWNGQGNPNNSSTYATAWNLEGNNFSASTSGGGGRGGYSYSNTQNNPNTTAPGNAAWGGDNRRNTGGLGGRPLDQTGGRLFFGGGGGAGDANDGVSTSGGNGGGLIYVLAAGRIARATTATTNITIAADGSSVTTASTNDGAGGGGGGGSIVLNTAGTVSNTLAVSAVGGQGGTQNLANNEAEGPGGGGGGGFITYTDAPASAVVTGGANGVTNSTGVNNVGNPAVSFPPNGATIGGAGITSTFTFNQQCLVTADVQTVLSGPNAGTVGQSIIYTAQTVNLSPDITATNVVPSITLPAGATNVVLPAGATLTGNVVTFASIASLAPNQNVTNTVRYTPAAAGTVTASAANEAGSPDQTVANNDGTAASAIVSTIITAPSATACASPGSNGPGVSAGNPTNLTTLSANPMSYFPGTSATVNATSTTLTVGAATGAGTAIAQGDLLLIIQMQGADLNATNTDQYGDGVPGLPANNVVSNTSYLAGQYEYAIAAAATPAGGGTVTLTTGLRNSYANATGTTAVAQKRFQVVRVPQYGNLTLSNDIIVTPWNGTTGGVFAVDVAGVVNFNGKTINADGAGFRGGANVNIGLGTAGASTASEFVLNSDATSQKGEGTAGTPALVNNGGAALSTGSAYVSGNAGRGAPGTAGGSGVRSQNALGFENSGGAGGANAGAGGRGGNNYNQALAIGGEPGAAFTVFSPNRLALGGGGGSGDSNDNVGSGGGAGGGLVLLRAGSATGTGTVSANGTSAASGQNDGQGGGGAGGSVLLTVDRGSLSTVTVSAQGGNGGNAVYAAAHGTGGGGGGGVVFANATLAASNVSGGVNGTTGDGNATSGNAFGATVGLGGAGPTGSTGQGAFGPTTLSTPVNNSVAGATCNPAPVAQNDVTTTTPGAAVTFNGATAILGNDSDVTGGLDATSVDLNPATNSQVKTRTIAGVGTWTVDATTGVLTFTPAGGFVGVATLPYTVNDIYGKPSNQAVATVTVESTRSDLSTTITSTPASGGTVSAGALVPYSVVATNNAGTGLSSASNVVQTVQLQTGLTAAQLTITGATAGTPSGGVITYTGGTFSGATYNQNTGVLTFPAVSLASGASQNYTFSAAAPASGPFTVLAQVGNGNVDPTPANNTASTTLGVSVKADLATTISGPTTNPTAGDLLTYNVTASNVGSSPATAVVQTVNIGTGRTNVYATNGGTYDSSTGLVTFPAIALAPGQVANNSVSFVAPTSGTVLSTVTSTFTSASLTSNNDTNTANNSATAASLTTQAGSGTAANVSTTLTATSGGNNVSPGTVTAGATVNYTARANNSGPGPAASVQEVVALPAGLTAAQLGITGSTSNSSAVVNGQTVITYAGGSFAGTTYNQATGVLTFPSAGTLAPQGSATYTFSVAAPNAPTLLAVASVSTTSIDPVTGDNVASTLTTIGQGTDVSVQLLGPTTAQAGQPVSYVATAFNNGPNTATGMVETVTIAAGLLTSTSNNNGLKINGSLPTSVDATTGVATYTGGITYDPRSGVVTFATLTSLASGASAQNTLTYLAPASATVANVAAVRSTSADTNPANNTSAVTTTVSTATDIVVAVSGPASATTGDLVTYAVTTTNNGTSTASGTSATALQAPTGLPVATSGNSLRVNGQYPANVNGTTGVATFADGSTYDPATGIVTFPGISSQLTGTASAVTNTVSFSAPSATSLNLVATVNPATGSADRNLDNNSASATTQLAAPSAGSADIAVNINPSVATQTAGQFVTFTVTPSNASTSATAGTNVQTQVVVTASQPTSGVNAIVVNGQSTPSSVNGTTGVATYTDGSTYNPATGVVTFPTTATLAVGATGTGFTVRVAAPGTGPLVAVASVRSDNNEGAALTADNVKSSSVAITASADLSTVVSGPSQTALGSAVAYTVTTTNLAPTTAGSAGGSPAVGATQTISIPANAATGTPTVSGPGTVAISGTAAGGYTITISYGTLNLGAAGEVVNTVSFTEASTTTYTVSATASTTGTGATPDPVSGNNPASQQTTIAPTGPVAADIVNNGRTGTNAGQSPIGNTAGQVAITSLAATVGSSSIASYNITAIPTVGTLYVNGTAVTAPRPLTLAEAAQLTYDPAVAGAQGSTTPSTLAANNDFFQFTATDNNGLVSNIARYTVPVNQDNLSVYTVITKGGNANQYQNGDVVAYGIDPNGAMYNTSGLIYNANGTTAAGTVNNGIATGSITNANTTTLAGVGIAYSSTTGLFTVTDRTKLPRAGRTIPVTITTTDLFGGVTVQTINIVLGAFPLPVELTDFTASAVRNVDAALL
ncbi:beta strand repeat-containing protein, partial [Hymenobacter negativus]